MTALGSEVDNDCTADIIQGSCSHKYDEENYDIFNQIHQHLQNDKENNANIKIHILLLLLLLSSASSSPYSISAELLTVSGPTVDNLGKDPPNKNELNQLLLS